jgi:hypothetical protein
MAVDHWVEHVAGRSIDNLNGRVRRLEERIQDLGTEVDALGRLSRTEEVVS